MDKSRRFLFKQIFGIDKNLSKQPVNSETRSHLKHRPGWVYIFLAVGYHGLFPGCFLKRCKIGLTHDVDFRLKRLESSQAPCDYIIVKKIHVKDMAAVETLLHKEFSYCNVELKHSREWFDLTIWNLWRACFVLNYYERHSRYSMASKALSIPLGAIAFVLVGLIVTISVIQQINSQHNTPPAQTWERIRRN